MANHLAPALDVPDEDRAIRTTWSRRYTLSKRLVTRSRIVLLASEGLANRQIAARIGTTLPTVQLWRSRYQREGLGRLEVDQVETWFSLLERKAIRRGVFHSVANLRTVIQRFLDAWNDQKHPFNWVKTADQILAKANR